MSHSSSQTEIGSIHSHKSQQRELSCPVSRSACLSPSALLLTHAAPLLEERFSWKQRYVKGLAPGHCLDVWRSSGLIVVQGFPKSHGSCRQDIQSMRAMQPQQLPPQQNQAGAGLTLRTPTALQYLWGVTLRDPSATINTQTQICLHSLREDWMEQQLVHSYS